MSGAVRDPARDRLTETITAIEQRFGGSPRVLVADYASVDLADPGAQLSWTYQAELPGPGNRAAVEDQLRAVGEQFAADGWQSIDRSMPDEPALQLSRDGFDIALTASRDGARVVVGGSTPPVPADELHRD